MMMIIMIKILQAMDFGEPFSDEKTQFLAFNHIYAHKSQYVFIV